MNQPTVYRGITQASEEWWELRRGIPTASEFHRFLTSDFELKHPQTKKAQESGELNASLFTYCCEKIAERERGPMLDAQSEANFSSFATEQGKMFEKLARSWFELEFGVEIEEVAFVKSADDLCGCSPDGLIGDTAGIEIKAPQGVNHVRYLLEGILPPDYMHQVHGSLYVTGRERWHFVSYNETISTAAFHIVVERDEAIMRRIGNSIEQFCCILDQLEKKLKGTP
jgi:YqaJ-like recombinase protein